MKGLMRSLIVIVLGGALAACTPGGGGSPTPTVTPTPSVTPTPTPQWTPEEQGAIDGVNHYLEVLTNISQNLDTVRWDTIMDVAREPANNQAFDMWDRWTKNGWHLVGAPTFTATLVVSGMGDYQGQRYWVYGCYNTEQAYLVDAAGNRLEGGGPKRLPTKYGVLHLKTGQHFVYEDTPQEGTC